MAKDQDLQKEGKIEKMARWGEKIQNFFIAIGVILGLRQRPAPGSEEEKKMPIWALSIISPWTREDEDRYTEAVDASTTNEQAQDKWYRFVDWAKSEGYDFYVIKMSLIRQNTRYQSEKTKTVNSAAITVNRIIAAHGNKKRQRQLGIDREILVKPGLTKIYFKFLHNHKPVAPFIFFFTILILIVLFALLVAATVWFLFFAAKNSRSITEWITYFGDIIVWATEHIWTFILWVSNWIVKFIEKLL